MNQDKIQDFYCQQVLSGKTKVKVLQETDHVLAFYHTRPSFTFHVAIIPKEHTRDLTTIENFEIIKEIFSVITGIIKEFDLEKKNYKVVTNGGSFQDNKHLHFHLLSGDKLHD